MEGPLGIVGIVLVREQAALTDSSHAVSSWGNDEDDNDDDFGNKDDNDDSFALQNSLRLWTF